jgi:hypothetical protein
MTELLTDAKNSDANRQWLRASSIPFYVAEYRAGRVCQVVEKSQRVIVRHVIAA